MMIDTFAKIFLLVFLCGTFSSCQGQQVTLYEHADFQGRQHSIPVSRCANFPSFQRMASSLRSSGCVILFEDTCCQGRSFTVNGDNKALHTFNDVAVSIAPCGNYRPPFPERHNVSWLDGSPETTRVIYNDKVAIYYNNGVKRTNVGNHGQFVDWAWNYMKSVYGDFGPEGGALSVFFYAGWGGGGTVATYFDDKDGCRNAVYLGSAMSDSWSAQLAGQELEILTHELSHHVEFGTKRVSGSPSRSIWGDSKFAEIFIYDVYGALDRYGGGRTTHQRDWQNAMQSRGSDWFTKWFHPIYSRYGGSRLLNNYFELLARHWPKNREGWRYEGGMNLGQFVHFWSGAAGTNLRTYALDAFKKETQYGQLDSQLQQAKRDFPNVGYVG